MAAKNLGERSEQAARRTLAEHKKLFALVAELERHLDRASREAPSASWAEELRSYLGELHDELGAHFAFEESSQFWEELAEAFPRAASRISRLVAEHDKIMESLEEVLGPAAEPMGGKNAASVDAGVRGAIARLRRHEAEEDELIQRLFCEDLGSGD